MKQNAKAFMYWIHFSFAVLIGFHSNAQSKSKASLSNKGDRPNILIIYADDLGYGDVGCYGATKVKTPNIDRIAAQGLKFTNGHATAATCTPSRYSLLTGEYAWRKKGTGIAPGNASLLIPTDRPTLPSVLKKNGYNTGIVGKWHLGLGPQEGPDWNGTIKPGPPEVGFNYSFIIPATADRVPCVYVQDHNVVNLDRNDPIQVSYTNPIGNEPTGKDHPELLTMKPSHGHDQTIINGISRIGYMSGGRSARWIDEEIGDVITAKAIRFIEENKTNPFFLYFATHDIHVPRIPNKRFVGKSGMGPRGDAIVELDWSTGELLKTLDRLQLTENTLIIFSSDNGPVVDDGYQDEAVKKLNGHTPAGQLRGGKYSAFDAGTRVPFIVSWPGKINPGVSDALVSQVDFMASLAALTGTPLKAGEANDSFNKIDVFLGKSKVDRAFVVEQALNNTLSLIIGEWKYIERSNGPELLRETKTETGYNQTPQLYNLKNDIGEKNNLAKSNAVQLQKMERMLKMIKDRK